jgi:competence protein ComEC
MPKADIDRSLRPGQEVELEGKLRLPRPARNPGEFDEKALLHDRGASWIMRVSAVRVWGAGSWCWLGKAWAESGRQDFEGFLLRVVNPDEARVLAGLCLGFKGPLRRDWNRAVQDAGAMHLLVPSGAKVAFVMLAVLWWARHCRLWPGPRLACAALAGGFYTLMVGADAPYTRAYFGGLVLGLCQLSGRDSGAFQAMCWSALITLLWEPRELFSVGFQMTYAAVAGLVVAMPNVQGLAPKSWPRLARAGVQVLAVSVIVQVMLWPIFANVFRRGSVIGVLANLLLVPASGVFMAGGWGAWFVSELWPGGARFMGPVLSVAAQGFIRVCQGFAGLPHAAVDLAPMSPAAVIVYYLLAMSVLVWPAWRPSLGLGMAGFLLWIACSGVSALTRPELRVLLMRQPGHPALLSFRDDKHWLVDPGNNVAAVLKILQTRRVSAVDKVVLTRPVKPRSLARLAAGIGIGTLERAEPPWTYCQGAVCCEFGGPDGPRVLKGEAQYSIIPSRLKLSAVTVVVDGGSASIR